LFRAGEIIIGIDELGLQLFRPGTVRGGGPLITGHRRERIRV
jgi:hypothetical protein